MAREGYQVAACARCTCASPRGRGRGGDDVRMRALPPRAWCASASASLRPLSCALPERAEQATWLDQCEISRARRAAVTGARRRWGPLVRRALPAARSARRSSRADRRERWRRELAEDGGRRVPLAAPTEPELIRLGTCDLQRLPFSETSRRHPLRHLFLQLHIPRLVHVRNLGLITRCV